MFRKIYLEITNVCNLACDFCPPTLRHGEFLSRERFELLLDRLAGWGDHLFFHLKGEPLLHPDLGVFLDRAYGRGLGVTLTTNGTLLGDRAGGLADHPALRQVNVSLHSQAGSGGLAAYWAGVCSFLDGLGSGSGYPVSLRLWNRGPGGYAPGTEALWNLVRGRYPALPGWESAEAQPSGIRLGPRVWLNRDDAFTWPEPGLPDLGPSGTCLGLGRQIGVLVDGTVVPCCLDGEGRLGLGNLFQEPLADILGQSRARALSEGFRAGRLVEPLCRTCGYRTRFG